MGSDSTHRVTRTGSHGISFPRWCVCFFLCISILVTHATKIPDPPKRNEYVGRWHGYAPNYSEFAVLELDAGGGGVFVLSELPKKVTGSYKVKSWSVIGARLTVTIEPLNTTSEIIKLENIELGSIGLSLTARGKTWHRKMELSNKKKYQALLGTAEEELSRIQKIN
jgi:hypothetical protein